MWYNLTNNYFLLWGDNMNINYSVYNSKIEARDLCSENALYNAMILIGISRNEDILNCIDADERYRMLQHCYNENIKSFSMCRRGVKFICAILKDKNTNVSIRKCMRYVYKYKGRSFYTDITITKFAESVMQTMNTDTTLMKLFLEVLYTDCDEYLAADTPILKDCVQHLFGFQYECLREIVERRENSKSRKSKKLKECLDEMDTVIRNAGYPKCRLYHEQIML